MSARPICQHCKKRIVQRPRGLCWTCYYTPGVKDLHPSTSIYARRGVGNGRGVLPLPQPTSAFPGTPEKLAVLEERAKRGQALWHPRDPVIGAPPKEWTVPVVSPGGSYQSNGRSCRKHTSDEVNRISDGDA